MSDSPAADRDVALMGIGFDALTEEQVVASVLRGGGVWVCTVNLDILRQCTEAPELAALVRSAQLVVADGAPVVWAAGLAGRPLPERVAGSSLIFTLTEGAARRGASVYLLGGNPGAAQAAAERLAELNPGLTVSSSCPPFGFEHDPSERRKIEADLRAAAPDIVFVGLSFPKQGRLIADLRPSFPDAWFVSCGISLSFVSGEITRAPRALQVAGLEWVHRLFQEPRRLARRYLVDGPPFVPRLVAAAVRARLKRS